MKVPKTISIKTKIVNGKFTSNLPMIKAVLEAYNGHTIEIVFKKRFNKRSNRQNAYYWGVIIPIMQNAIKVEWGELYNKEQVHELLKANCNYEEIVNENTGEIIRRIKSTTENNTNAQEEFHNCCRELAKDYFNTTIPLPNEDIRLEF
jgi:hypothetical protein